MSQRWVPQAEIDRLKRSVSVVDLVRKAGIELRPHGKDLAGLCPFHDDKEPSLIVTPKKNLWNCLGACGEGGSVIDWVMKLEGVTFRQAVELLREGYSPSIEARAEKPVVRSTSLKFKPIFDLEMDDAELLETAVDFYWKALQGSSKARDYLDSRGLASAELIDHFQLGYADRTLGYRIPRRATVEGRALRDRLQALGLFRETGHEFFTGSLVVPVRDADGRVVEIYGRRISDEKIGAKHLKHKYLPGPHAGVWNAAGLEGSKDVILCEALLDALTFWHAGLRHVTSAYGINGFTAEHLETFKRCGVERVLIAYDRDAAGEAAALELAEKLMAEGLDCYRVLFPRGMDANEFALTSKPAAKALALLVQNAQWMGQGRRPAAATPDGAAVDRAGVAEDPTAARPAELPALGESAPAREASPMPEPPKVTADVEVKEEEVVIRLGDRRVRVRGLAKNLAYDVMKVNLLVTRRGALHTDTFDLYQARGRTAFVKQASAELQMSEGQVKKDLGQVLLALEQLQEKQIREALAPKEEPAVELTDAERREALGLLEDPRLFDRILEDFERCGMVGEETNKLVGYLAAVSRKLEDPLAVIIQSSSSAGKTSLMEAILAFVPDEERVQYSAMTGQSLFYMGETDLQHKILAIVEEEGAEKATYALKLLQSEGELTIASTGKDPHSGRLVTEAYRVEGPVMILLTTTAVEIDEELLNRCLVLTVDESREQTRAIHRLQRQKRTLDGLFARRDRSATQALHRNAQRLLEPLAVVNPWAQQLTFVDDKTRTRRDHEKYLTLIDTIALVHQHQRKIHTARRGEREVRYLEVTLEDVGLANRLAGEVLGRSLDELPPQTRRFLTRLDEIVEKACAELEAERTDYLFTARWVRESLGTGPTQTWVHLKRLVELEYLVPHRSRRGQQVLFELVYHRDPEREDVFLPGLLDVEALRRTSGDHSASAGELSALEASDSVLEAEHSGRIRPVFGPLSDPGSVDKSSCGSALDGDPSVSPEIATREGASRRTAETTDAETTDGSGAAS